MPDPIGRRAFLTLAPAGLGAVLALLRPVEAAPAPLAPRPEDLCRSRHGGPGRAGADGAGGGGGGGAWEHPEPRPGIDGSNVLTADQLMDAPHVVELFDGIREIPHIADGIRCHCGCAQLDGYRSLLSCYEGVGMAKWCEICQGAARLAIGRVREGQTLDQIRRAIDARYASGS